MNRMPFNKHIVSALIVTPILAIIAWFAVDYQVREKPHAAREGALYELLEMPNCRYQSGHCTIKNGDVIIELTGRFQQDGTLLLNLQSALPLDGVRVAMINGGQTDGPPALMTPADAQRTQWQSRLPRPSSADDHLRLAIAAGQTFYFAEVSTLFIDYHTAFDKDFRRQSRTH